ncbi:hypothetical protein OCH239_10840 [Roseivivax halodurans JCM 10272]|uniref:ATP-grasp domain-containing protein n=1 Tax=Roseivivax halodurans JCM 10272 TaxID=1449350 RepID=X7EDR9_9RHOB|nr:hypothetical protein [Roseivivax halodurans]ETX13331.1 hypothetical protein OCH239_10840 [Roseivivax halodurans JCM 10272]
MKIHYNIPPLHQMEPDIRLADAMLFAALSSALGERIQPYSSLHAFRGDGPLWGPDPYEERTAAMALRRAPYHNAFVQEALGGSVIVPACKVQAEMDRLSRAGLGAAVRNMLDPSNRKRFLAPGSSFGISQDHIRVNGTDPVLVHPNRDTHHERRFLVVAGEIAGESPLFFCGEDPALLLDPANRRREARTPWSELEDADPERLARQREAVERLLRDYPLVSGAIDVASAEGPDGTERAHVVEVTAARPGGVDIFFADPVVYAETVAAHLAELEPDVSGDDELAFRSP